MARNGFPPSCAKLSLETIFAFLVVIAFASTADGRRYSNGYAKFQRGDQVRKGFFRMKRCYRSALTRSSLVEGDEGTA